MPILHILIYFQNKISKFETSPVVNSLADKCQRCTFEEQGEAIYNSQINKLRRKSVQDFSTNLDRLIHSASAKTMNTCQQKPLQ